MLMLQFLQHRDRQGFIQWGGGVKLPTKSYPPPIVIGRRSRERIKKREETEIKTEMETETEREKEREGERERAGEREREGEREGGRERERERESSCVRYHQVHPLNFN